MTDTRSKRMKTKSFTVFALKCLNATIVVHENGRVYSVNKLKQGDEGKIKFKMF